MWIGSGIRSLSPEAALLLASFFSPFALFLLLFCIRFAGLFFFSGSQSVVLKQVTRTQTHRLAHTQTQAGRNFKRERDKQAGEHCAALSVFGAVSRTIQHILTLHCLYRL